MIIAIVDRDYVYHTTYMLSIKLSEKEELKSMVDGLVWYRPRKEELTRYGSGGVAIIDQWIASHAQYFIGKHYGMRRVASSCM